MPFKVLSFPVVLLACFFLLAYASPIPAALSPSAFGRDNVVARGTGGLGVPFDVPIDPSEWA
ncbi:hypothetical protein M405DRAFT_821472 [Rhizopogon salebrosus TDB-379]|nr:hypothetical protein M405DRAFT_821472 [Rhizopogon salebrosus TDB-379]